MAHGITEQGVPDSAPENVVRVKVSPLETYDKLYTVIRDDPRLDLKAKWTYTILRGMCRLTGRLDSTNAVLEEKTGLPKRTLQEALATLHEHGLVKITALKNERGTTRYIDFPALDELYPGGHAKSAHPHAKSARLYKESTDVTTNETTTTPSNSPSLAPIPGPDVEEEVEDYSDVGELEEGRTQVVYPTPEKPNLQAQKNSGATPSSGVRVSNQVGREQDHPYWANDALGSYHRQCFDMTMAEYPKPINRQEAMTAWREVIGDRMDQGEQSKAFKTQVWQGLQWWNKYWKEKGTEERFIPMFANWIRKERWAEAQVGS